MQVRRDRDNIVQNQILNKIEIMHSFAARYHLTHGPVPVRDPGVKDTASLFFL